MHLSEFTLARDLRASGIPFVLVERERDVKICCPD